MYKGKKPIQEEDYQPFGKNNQYFASAPLVPSSVPGAISELSSSANRIALKSSNFGYDNDLYQRTVSQNQLTSYENQRPKNSGIGSNSLLDLRLNSLNENQKDGFQNLGCNNNNNIGGTHMQGSDLHTLDDLLSSSTLVGGFASPNSDGGSRNLILNNISLDRGSTQGSYLHNLGESRQAVYQNFLSINTSSLLDSHIHTPSQNQQANYENLLPNNTSTAGGSFPDSNPHTLSKYQKIQNQNLLPNDSSIGGSSLPDPHLYTLNGNQLVCPQSLQPNSTSISSSSSPDSPLEVGYNQNRLPSDTTIGVGGNETADFQNLLSNNNSIGSSSLRDPGSHSHSPSRCKQVNYEGLIPNNTSLSGISLQDSHLHTGGENQNVNAENLQSNNTRIIGSTLQGSHANTRSQNQPTDSGSLLPNDSSDESGFAEWGSTSGTSFLNEFEENDDFLSIFNNINHINPPDQVFPVEPTSDSALSAPTDPPVPVTPAASLPPEQPSLIALSSRMREVLPTEMLQQLVQSDPKRARRIMTNRKAALKANDRKKRYVMELEGRIHILQTKSGSYKSELTLLEVTCSNGSELFFAPQVNFGTFWLRITACILEQQSIFGLKLNERASEDIQNLRKAVGLKPTDGVMQLATRKVPALNQRPQLSANSSAQQRDMLRLVQQFPRLQVQAPNQHQPPHYQAPQLMETLGAAQLPQRQVQALNLKQQSLCQAPQLIQSPTTTQRLPFQPSSSQLQLHSGHLIMYNTSRNNQSSNRTRVFSQGHRYQLQQFPRNSHSLIYHTSRANPSSSNSMQPQKQQYSRQWMPMHNMIRGSRATTTATCTLRNKTDPRWDTRFLLDEFLPSCYLVWCFCFFIFVLAYLPL
ncbi:bZIP transcription factor 18 [Vitis vinifera]|uniref:BZIP transcription factor 18 n=1 Tax=Vitis vinifera TaxID=29760 RepID=A0A438KPP8_VITVI|nr:bZIP transcription factor 18 [Vitis vinifera]